MRKIIGLFLLLSSSVFANSFDTNAMVKSVEWDASTDKLFVEVTRSNGSVVLYYYVINTANANSVAYAHSWEAMALSALNSNMLVDLWVVTPGTSSAFGSLKVHK
jgi:hypothetical protein